MSSQPLLKYIVLNCLGLLAWATQASERPQESVQELYLVSETLSLFY